MRATGLSTPVLVRPRSTNEYELVSGERRWRAAKELGWESIQAICEEMTDAERAARVVTENEVRADTNLMEKAAGYKRLTEPPCNFTLEEIAKRYGYRSHTSVIAIMRPTRPTHGNPGACRTCDNRGETRPFSESNQRLERESQIGETSRGREVVRQDDRRASCEGAGEGGQGTGEIARERWPDARVRLQRLSLQTGGQRGHPRRPELQPNEAVGEAVRCGLPAGARELSRDVDAALIGPPIHRTKLLGQSKVSLKIVQR